MTLETLGMFSPEATGVRKAGDEAPSIVVGDSRCVISLRCSAPPCLWPLLEVQLLTA